MAETTYTGGCHCGKVRYEASVDLDRAMSCNCSRCAKLGWILTFTPAQNFKLVSGRASLKITCSTSTSSIICSARPAALNPSPEGLRRTVRRLLRSTCAAWTTSTSAPSSRLRSMAEACKRLRPPCPLRSRKAAYTGMLDACSVRRQSQWERAARGMEKLWLFLLLAYSKELG
jgi:hypothetical protein